MPDNLNPVEAFNEARHLDLQGELHLFFDALLTGQRVLDVGAGLGKSKVRIRHNRVTTYEPSVHCRDLVDLTELPAAPFDVVAAFEVLEHVQDDVGFLRTLDRLATRAVFLTTPNYYVHGCRSRHHYREYTNEELRALVLLIWPECNFRWFAYHKDPAGGWCEQWDTVEWLAHRERKHVVLVAKDLRVDELRRIDAMYAGRRLGLA